MRLCEILPELAPEAWRRWAELARSVSPHDPLRLLKYPGRVEHTAKTGNETAVALLGLHDEMLRALVAAGVDGRIEGHGLNGVESVYLNQPHWLLLDGLAAETLRRAIDLGNNRIHLPGESLWDDGGTVWDYGETRWDVGAPETNRAMIEGVVVDYADLPFAARSQAAAVAAEAEPQAVPTPSSKPRQRRRPGKMARRVQLVFDSENADKWPSTSAKAAVESALAKATDRRDATAIGLLTEPPDIFLLWRAAQALLDKPGTPIPEILRTLRRPTAETT